MEIILCAAIHYDDDREHDDQPQGIQYGFVICGRRHSDCYTTVALLTGDTDLGNTIDRNHQGFITSSNRYVSRAEAWTIALAANQIIRGKTAVDPVDAILISESLY